MNLHQYYAVFFVVYCILPFFGINAYPTLNIRRFFGPGLEGRYKKNDLTIPQVEDDVLELEHLKNPSDDEIDDIALVQQPQQRQHEDLRTSQTHDKNESDLAILDTTDNTEILPALERQLEYETASTSLPPGATVKPTAALAGQLEHEPSSSGQGAHRPPTLQTNDGGKSSHKTPQQPENPHSVPEFGSGLQSMTKPFYGAARLAFGQNPEVLPTFSTTSTFTMAATTKSVSSSEANSNGSENAKIEAATQQETSVPLEPFRPSNPDQEPILGQDGENSSYSQNKEMASPTDLDELEATKTIAARRSMSPHTMSPKTAESLLTHKDREYSPFDMAQYVFWTGDEVGVAQAVEEFINQGLMSRENALKFLREIRLGIEYLQRSYENRIFPKEIRENNIKKSFLSPTSTIATTTTTEKPFPRGHLGIGRDRLNNLQPQKPIDSMKMWNKLQELNNENRQELGDYDESAGRAKIAEFLYTEYTLEEILYNLAKVMFTQSLAQGSGEAQQELQKLTDFLEREGNRGVIPLDLQKKVLHVLLTALSDTLIEHPELLPAARLNLGSSLNSLPIHNSYGTFQ